MRILSKFIGNQSGATAVEYGLIAVLIGVGIIAGASALGISLNDLFAGLATNQFGG